MQRLTILAIVSCASVGQTAEKPVAELEVPFIERPMTLPQRVARPTLEGDLSQTNGPSGGAGGSMAAAIDVGITARFQAGVLIAFPIAPDAGFGDLIFNAQGNLWRDKLNLRVDLGWQRQASSSAHVDTFFAEIGLPWRARFNRYVALIGSGTWARDYATPFEGVFGTTGIWAGAAAYSSGLLSMQVASDPLGFKGTSIVGSLHLPLGLLIQPHPIVSFAARTGYRLQFQHSESTAPSKATSDLMLHFVPLAFDVVFDVVHVVDLGFTATIVGFLSGGGSASGMSPTIPISLSGGYADLQRYDFWISTHF